MFSKLSKMYIFFQKESNLELEMIAGVSEMWTVSYSKYTSNNKQVPKGKLCIAM